jgi:hypothetical protein
MAGDKKQETTSEVRINPELAAAGQQALSGSERLYDQGTGGIYQGSQLADQNALIQQAQNQQLAMANGGIQNQVNAQQGAFTNLLNAGNLDGNSLFQRQVADALDQANTDFGRGSVGIFQNGTAAGQFGSSEVGESLGLFGGEVNRNMQNAITQAALGGQQVALGAQQLAPQSIGLGLLPSQITQDIGNQRTARSQQDLQNEIQQYNAPRQAQLQNQAEFQNFLASNPLIGESTQTNTQVTEGNALQSALGAAATIGGIAGGPIGSMIGGGVSSMFGGGGSTGLTGSVGATPFANQQLTNAFSANPFGQ